MIRINLLTSYAASGSGAGVANASEDDEKKRIIGAAAIRIVVLIIAPVGMYIYESQNIPTLQAQQAEITQKYTEMKEFNDSKQGLAQEIKKYEEEQARFNAQMDFINKISADKVNEYKLFLHIKDSTPDSVWINKLELMENVLSISAESDDAKEIEKFIQRLSNADFITNLVPLNQINKTNYGGTGVATTQFTVRAQLHSGSTP